MLVAMPKAGLLGTLNLFLFLFKLLVTRQAYFPYFVDSRGPAKSYWQQQNPAGKAFAAATDFSLLPAAAARKHW